LSAVAGCGLVVEAARQGNSRYLLGCSIFVVTMAAMYSASMLSHAFARSGLRRLFRTLDQAVIYLFITGTFTPLALVYLDGGWWTALLVTMWTIALGGFLSKVLWSHRIEAISTRLYLVQGWLPVVAAGPISQVVPGDVLQWMLAGGLCYTFGVAFLILDRRVPYFHSVWHMLVIGGSACHYHAIALISASL
jgi:hemolysin III